MKTCGEMEIYLHTFSTQQQMEVSDLLHAFTVLLPVKDLKFTFIVGWVCLKAGLNSVEERQISANGKVNIVSA
jgi:hypothetical protein